MAFKVPQLPYAYDALAPHVDETTMRVHHTRHHQAYVDKANAALEGTPWADVRPRDLLTRLDELPDDLRQTVRDNAGGHYNHCLLWRSMRPGGGGAPIGALADALDDAFGSFDAFKEQLTAAAVGRFGSGYAWLVLGPEGLAVLSTPNQDNPVTDGLAPLLGIDVWEHAYYLRYQNRRPEYVEAFFGVVDWDTVLDRYAEAAAEYGISG